MGGLPISEQKRLQHRRSLEFIHLAMVRAQGMGCGDTIPHAISFQNTRYQSTHPHPMRGDPLANLEGGAIHSPMELTVSRKRINTQRVIAKMSCKVIIRSKVFFHGEAAKLQQHSFLSRCVLNENRLAKANDLPCRHARHESAPLCTDRGFAEET